MDRDSKGGTKTEHLRPKGKQTYSAEIRKQSLKITWTQIFSSVRSNIFEQMIKGIKPTGNTKKDFLPQHSRGIRNTNTLPSALPFSMINSSSSSLMEAKLRYSKNQIRFEITLFLLNLALLRAVEFPVLHRGYCVFKKDPFWSKLNVSLPYELSAS